ncbi:XdhC family protein [Achromobacter sp.]|uniref:XdhC family protein n=1 Tax=Achromobacter sp. TaxID=134375 RepID=UPI0028B17090|nr:XdhC family protein [Achromobacter sp.]
MQSLDMQVLAALREWGGLGLDRVLATVASTWGASPRQPGALLAIRGDGRVMGSVSGGCIEDDLIEKMRQGKLCAPLPYAVVYGGRPDDAMNFGLPCGGTLELVIETNPDAAQLAALEDRLRGGRLARRSVDLLTGVVTVTDAQPGDAVAWDGCTLSSIHGPQWRLLLVGAGDIARYIAPMAQALEFDVQVCDPREEYASTWDVPGTTLLTCMPDDAVSALRPDARTAIVMLSHDPKLDDMALLEAIGSPAFYVGALGSRRSNDKRRQRLKEHFGFTEADVQSFKGPVGLDIGSHTPPEIAVSILAELTAVRNRLRNSGAGRGGQGNGGRVLDAEVVDKHAQTNGKECVAPS